jgi:Tfp pilus assembly protein PilE
VSNLLKSKNMQNQRGFILPIIIIVVVVAVLGTAGYLAYKSEIPNPKSETNSNIQNPNDRNGNQVVCAQDAKQCPNGSYVGRTGPTCDFAECPTQNVTVKSYTYVKGSFNVSNKTFNIIEKSGKVMKIVVTDKTKIYYNVSGEKGNVLANDVNFLDFANSRNNGCVIMCGFDETIKGKILDGDTIQADEISWWVQ